MGTTGIFLTTLLAAFMFAGGFCSYWRVIEGRWSFPAFYLPLLFFLAVAVMLTGVINFINSFYR